MPFCAVSQESRAAATNESKRTAAIQKVPLSLARTRLDDIQLRCAQAGWRRAADSGMVCENNVRRHAMANAIFLSNKAKAVDIAVRPGS